MGVGFHVVSRAVAVLVVAAQVVSAGPASAQGAPVTLLAAGDIAYCKPTWADKLFYLITKGRKFKRGNHKTARLLDRLEGTIVVLGDLAYREGSAEQFEHCYDPTWGRHKERTYPAPGNHEYRSSSDAAPYFAYWGERAGGKKRGYYSFDLGAWHIIALNSNIKAGRKSKQLRWLRADLAETTARCILAFWHHPMFSSGGNGDHPMMRHAYRALYEAGASVVLAGHDHIYERFAPRDPEGRRDEPRGIRSFVVGTGGAPLGKQRRTNKTSEVVRTGSWGVLEFTLHQDRYDWEFVTLDGRGKGDTGSAACVERAPLVQAAN
ncbi:MAG: metallophosphoesterase [Rhodospirillales bacterium]|nr:metallophosphoesterase [Rhodospirillales bacterium]MDH3792606.1 metallophosphoesterase [Rhodospirillales bacterium]MDH3912148.1 metallophosphoesterase [Rhodospirillales bacterium]MDH3918435.1 metallophosphoesterase [Rhodospirillales bacterium]MDH3969324.1 metallophosphoesterase [Rhodospirillales bacterium]